VRIPTAALGATERSARPSQGKAAIFPLSLSLSLSLSLGRSVACVRDLQLR